MLEQSRTWTKPALRTALVSSLYGPFPSLVAGIVAVLTAGFAALATNWDPAILACSLAFGATGLGRVALNAAYRRAKRTGDATRRAKAWQRYNAAISWTYCAFLGGLTGMIVLRSPDIGAHMVAAAVNASYSGGISGRNAAFPKIATGQVLLATGPFALACLAYGDAMHVTLGILFFMFLFGVWDITRGVHVVMVKAMVSTSRNAGLARRLKAQNERFDAALTNMSQGLAMFGADGRLTVCNRRFCEMLGIPSPMAAVGARMQELYPPVADAADAQDSRDERVRQMFGSPGTRVIELTDGRCLSVSCQPLSDGGCVVTHDDITERQRDALRIAHMARHDALTDLPNRTLFRDHLEKAFAHSRRQDCPFAVLFLDLDRFKHVNDTLGHPVGDALLRQVSARLKSCLRDTDTVARLGGDEFAILLIGANLPHGAGVLAERIVEAVSQPYVVEGHHVSVGTSVGIALSSTAGPDEILKQADLALYRAKAEGRGTFRFFEPAMGEKAQARRRLEMDLRHAIPRGEFRLAYHPFVDTDSGTVLGFEALIRWKHPTRGVIPPNEFIPLAEETGVIGAIGDWVLCRACADAAHWPDGVRLAVNLSPSQTRSHGLVGSTLHALSSSGLPASRLELEVTETCLIDDPEAAMDNLHRLKELGIRISLDDFGAGPSSLGYLQAFPFDRIKIDRNFTTAGKDPHKAEAIVQAMASLGASLGMAVTAEGIESEDQLQRLRLQGCSEVQGYLISQPMAAEQVKGFLSQGHLTTRAA